MNEEYIITALNKAFSHTRCILYILLCCINYKNHFFYIYLKEKRLNNSNYDIFTDNIYIIQERANDHEIDSKVSLKLILTMSTMTKIK